MSNDQYKFYSNCIELYLPFNYINKYYISGSILNIIVNNLMHKLLKQMQSTKRNRTLIDVLLRFSRISSCNKEKKKT